MREDYLPFVIATLLVAFFLLLPPKYSPVFLLRQWLGKKKGRK